MKQKIKLYFHSIRGPFLIASAIPVVFAGSFTYFHSGTFNWPLFLVTLLGIVTMHAAANTTNEYFDYKNKTDVVNRNRTIFSGGSGILVRNEMTPGQYRISFIILYAISLACGLYLFLHLGDKGWVILALAAAGFLLTFFYSCPPVNFAHRGLGEIVIGLCFGPLPVLGTYFVLTGKITLPAMLISLPIMFLIIAVLYINQYPDVEADSFAHKRNLVTRLGRKKARAGYYILMLFTYATTVALTFAGYLSPYSIIGLLTIPLAVKASMILHRNFQDPKRVFPAQGLTILNHHITGVLLIGSLIIDGVINQ